MTSPLPATSAPPPAHARQLWSRPPARPAARITLLCFPYAGGGAALFRPWADLLPPWIEPVALQLPGRGPRLADPPFTSLGQVIDAIVDALPLAPGRPFACFGHSLGTLVAYELARRLREAGRPLPCRLILSGRRAAHRPDPDPPIHGLPRAEFFAELARLGGTPPEVLADAELMDLLEPLLRADFAINENYRWHASSPLPLPMTIFGGTSDTETPLPELVAWRDLSSAPADTRLFPGGHFFIHDLAPDLCAAIARALAADLALPAPPAP